MSSTKAHGATAHDAKARWDGSRVLFEIEVGGTPVACAMSVGALQEISGCTYIASGDMLRRFLDRRDRIEQIAASLFAVRPRSVTGTLNIWADDIEELPVAAVSQASPASA